MKKSIRKYLVKNSYLKNYYVLLADKLSGEIFSRYLGVNYCFEKILWEILKFKKGRIMIPFLDFSVTTFCTLNCRDCTQWIPYLEKRMTSAEEIIGELDALFDKIDAIMFLSPLGGEPFIHPEFARILDYLIQKQKDGKIKYIRIVTNGTVVPSPEVIELLRSKDVFVLISNYTDILNSEQLDNRNSLIELLDLAGAKYYLVDKEFQWTDMGQPQYRNKTSLEVNETYRTCFIRDCVGWYGGKIYKCPRQYYVEENCGSTPVDECIDYKELPKKSIKAHIRKFYSLCGLQACQYCANKEERKDVVPAIQILKNVNLGEKKDL